VLRLMKEPVELDEDQTVAIFRIVQESLTNVTRHAAASHVEIILSQEAGDLLIEVRDNGKGFNATAAARKKSFGLVGMRERAAVLGGSIDIASLPRQGTVVKLRLPVKVCEEVS
ncbi:histidine kinase/DNA gyrase B/HSP90-like ATPase, partial [Nitrosospira sp. Nsp5]